MIQVSTVKQWFSEVRSRPLELLIGVCIVSVAATGGAVKDVASTALAILFISCLFYVRKWPQLWTGLSRHEQWLLLGFALFALSGFLSYYNAGDQNEYVRHMGRYIRFLLIVPVYLLLARPDLKLFRYLLAGAMISGPIYLVFTLISLSAQPLLPAAGHYHHITFGDSAMLNAVFMLGVLAAAKPGAWMKTLLAVSILCVLYAAMMSQARGAWIVLPIGLVVLIYTAVKSGHIKLRPLLVALILVVAVLGLSPVKNIIEKRYDEAVAEIERFTSGEQFDTSIGGRLAMWHVALKVWQEYPFVGTGPGDFDEELVAYQEGGLYPSIEVHSSTHNIYLQSLATTGLIGFIVLCAGLVVIPLRLFIQAEHRQDDAARLGGVMTLVAFAIFGLTESWILRAPMVSIYLVYIITLASRVSRRPETIR